MGFAVPYVVEEVFGVSKAVIGVVHLPPLPGSPSYSGEDLNAIVERALRDAKALEEGGVDGVLIENFWDLPYRKPPVEPSTVACMSVVALEISRSTSLPLGVNVLRNDALASIAIAKAVGGRFIRVNVYAEVAVTDQGVIEPVAHQVQVAKKLYYAGGVKVFADVNVKHASPLATRPLEDVAEEAVSRGLADAVIVTGPKTGEPPRLDDLHRVKARVKESSVIVGSGCTPENAADLLACADAVIVGTYFKEGGMKSPVSKVKVERLVSKVREIRSKLK